MTKNELPESRGFSVTIDIQFEPFLENNNLCLLMIFLCDGFQFFVKEEKFDSSGEYYRLYSYLPRNLNFFLKMATEEAFLCARFNSELQDGAKWETLRPKLVSAFREWRKKHERAIESTLKRQRVGVPIGTQVDQRMRGAVKHFAKQTKMPSKTGFAREAGFKSVKRFNEALSARNIDWDSVKGFIELEKKVNRLRT